MGNEMGVGMYAFQCGYGDVIGSRDDHSRFYVKFTLKEIRIYIYSKSPVVYNALHTSQNTFVSSILILKNIFSTLL